MLELIAFIPTLCVLGLVVFGLAGYEPTAPAVLWTVAGAIMGGPVVVTLFGFARLAADSRRRHGRRDRVRRESPPPDPRVILEPAMTEYLTGLEPEPDPLLAEMRAHGDRDHIPIVEDVTGGLLEVLAASTRRARARSRSAPRSASRRCTSRAAART